MARCRIVAAIVSLAAMLAVIGAEVVQPFMRDVSLARGLFSREQITKTKPSQNKYWGATIADVDRDGRYDIIVSNHGNKPEMYFQTGSRNFEYFNTRLANRDIHGTAAGDLNGDGYLEVFFTVGGGNGNNVMSTPYIFTGNRDREYKRGQGQSYSLGDMPMRARSMGFVDVDCDGDLDILYLNRANLTATVAHLVYANNDGQFEYVPETGFEEDVSRWFQIADVNDDSKMDLILMGFANSKVYLGTGEFRFVESPDILPGLANIRDVRACAEVDIDGDGRLDLYFAVGSLRRNSPQSDVIYMNTVDGFVKHVAEDFGIPKSESFHVTYGDLNNDGWMDLVLSIMTGYRDVRQQDLVYLNDGGTFVPATDTNVVANDPFTDGDSATIFDFDDDGRTDMLVLNRNGTSVLYRNKTPFADLGNWITVRVGRPRAEFQYPQFFRQAMGALVKVFCNGNVFMQRVGSPGQSHSQSFMETLHFGVGDCERIERIEIHYTGDVVVTRTTSIAVNRVITMGFYFPCEPGLINRNCNRTIPACSLDPCPRNRQCDVAELIREKCEMNSDWCLDPDVPQTDDADDNPDAIETELPVPTPTECPGCMKVYCPI